jgi:ATP phosphoribosyltransferase
MTTIRTARDLRLALPKGRIGPGVTRIFEEAGIDLMPTARSYRPRLSLDRTDAKILKPQTVVEMLVHAKRDVGFAGADWVAELDADVVEVLDTGLDPVRLVVAAHVTLRDRDPLPSRPLVLASEYIRIAERWMADRGLTGEVLRSWGATEVFPPEDADLVLDNTATGSTLEANDLEIVDEVMTSSTRLYASREAWEDPERRARIDELALLLRSVLDARRRVMVEANCPAPDLEAVLAVLPAMREPTVSSLAGGQGFAVKAAVERSALAALVPALKSAGASDIVVSSVAQIVS